MTKVVRLIRYFEKEGDDLVGEISLPQDKLNLGELQKLFHIPSENPMYDCYRITNQNVKFFQNLIRHEFDFEKYEYFFECDAVE
ncbi:MAG: hypothetical protein H6858_04715 [Rhodospirillales bacterium]|nr:hypothetical protein [Alphaproteobacteria bacterium]MCB9976888.1 hypothetical protein [Rhodospirillales bacterium]